MATKTKLIFTPPSGIKVKYSLDRSGAYILGTANGCDITLEDDQLAEKHGKLVADETNEARWFLQILETGAIIFLEDGSEHSVGNTKVAVSIEQLKDEAAEDEEPSAKFSTANPADNERQLRQLEKAQQLRELKSTVILVIICGILAFAAGVAFRLMK